MSKVANVDIVEREIRQAIRDYIQRQPLEVLRAHCKTAEAWFDGNKSMMLKFYREDGHLDSGDEYAKLSREANKAAGTVSPALENAASLAALAKFAQNVFDLERKMNDIAVSAQELVRGGVIDGYVTGVAHAAIQVYRAEDEA